MRPRRPLAMLTGLAFALALSPAARAAATPDEELAYLKMTLPDEELVESATRAPKPLTQVAENVTVVTAEEIEAMNAHTLAEVLNRVTGVFVQFLTGGRFGDVSVAHIQGSGNTVGYMERHVPLLLDGTPWAKVGTGEVQFQTVPVGLIDRIEVVKGPASSTWGSALGGVINVITKKAGTSAVPHGAAQGSYGERRTYDTRAEAAGAVGPMGYYLDAEAQGAEWQATGTDYRARSLFGKVEARPGRDTTLSLTLLTSRPEYEGEHEAPLFREYRYPAFLAAAAADARLAPGAALHLGGFVQRLSQRDDVSWDGTPAYGRDWPAGESAVTQANQERNRGLNGLLTWAGGGHTVTAGAEYFRGRVENDFENGPSLQQFFDEAYGPGAIPPSGDSVAFLERWGVFVNDTVLLGPLTLTPGLRFDDTSLTDGFWSPSLGATLRLGASTLLRGQVARGFTAPPVNHLAGDATNPANPDLDAEKVWSWQGGVETLVMPAVRLKLAAFRHEVKDSLRDDPETGMLVNSSPVWRQGLEMEAETASFAGLSATGGFAWTWIKQVGVDRDQDLYQANLGLRYARGTFRADLFGHFVWWDLGPGSEEGKKDDFLWDLAASKTVLSLGPVGLDLFGGIHNLFNGRQYQTDLKNPDRWVEGGARLRF